MKSLAFVSGFAILSAGVLSAQETPRFSFDIGGGFTDVQSSGGGIEQVTGILGGGDESAVDGNPHQRRLRLSIRGDS